MMPAALVCFLTGNYVPGCAVHLGGPLLWFLGTVFGIIWVVFRFFTENVSSAESSTTPAPDRATDNAHKNIRAALPVFAGILPSFLLVLPAGAADTSTGMDLFKSRCTMCHGPNGSEKTPMGRKIGVPDLDSAGVQGKSEADVESMIAKGTEDVCAQKKD